MNLKPTRSFAAVLLSLAAAGTQAAPIALSGAAAGGNGGGTLSFGSLANATDGNLGTGYLVTNTGVAQAYGFWVRFDFDISGYSQVDAFTFDFTGVYNSDSSGVQDLRFGADPFMNFTLVGSPIGQQFSYRLATSSLGSGFGDTDNYISGNTLSVYVQTDLGAGPGATFTSINTLELTANIEGTRVVPPPQPVPEPGTLALAGLAGLMLMTRRRPSPAAEQLSR